MQLAPGAPDPGSRVDNLLFSNSIKGEDLPVDRNAPPNVIMVPVQVNASRVGDTAKIDKATELPLQPQEQTSTTNPERSTRSELRRIDTTQQPTSSAGRDLRSASFPVLIAVMLAFGSTALIGGAGLFML